MRSTTLFAVVQPRFVSAMANDIFGMRKMMLTASGQTTMCPYGQKHKKKDTIKNRVFLFGYPEFCSNQRHIRSEISSHCSACSTSHCSYFFLRRHRLFLPPAAAVPAPVNSLRLFIQNAVSIKVKNQKRNHPFGWFLFWNSYTFSNPNINRHINHCNIMKYCYAIRNNLRL